MNLNRYAVADALSLTVPFCPQYQDNYSVLSFSEAEDRTGQRTCPDGFNASSIGETIKINRRDLEFCDEKKPWVGEKVFICNVWRISLRK